MHDNVKNALSSMKE